MSAIAWVRGGVVGILASTLWVVPGLGQSIPKPVGPTILTVTGLDPVHHPGGQVAFDLAMLKALPQATISTSSIWTDGLHDFTGVPLAALASFLQLSDVNLRLHALNDYSVDMPLSETEAEVPILAYQIDGALMPVRDKGPIWIIYPFDESAEYRTDTIYSRSVWQLDRIEVLR
jgi:hypothetical protein